MNGTVITMYACFPPDMSQPNPRPYGWICPKCGACINPTHDTCPFCKEEIKRFYVDNSSVPNKKKKREKKCK